METLRRETSFRRDWRVGIEPAPIEAITGKGVTVRLPHDGDVAHLIRYGSDDALLAGMWLGYPDPDVSRWAMRMVSEWGEGWSLAGSDAGPVLIIDAADPFVGIINLFPQQERSIEMLYGVLPTARNQNIATRAVELTTDWLLSLGQWDQVELKIGEENVASQRVAEKVGFRFIERFETLITGTGQVVIDHLYVKKCG